VGPFDEADDVLANRRHRLLQVLKLALVAGTHRAIQPLVAAQARSRQAAVVACAAGGLGYGDTSDRPRPLRPQVDGVGVDHGRLSLDPPRYAVTLA
jgi:hypothetical protein